MSIDEGNLQVVIEIDVDVILENYPITIIPLRYIHMCNLINIHTYILTSNNSDFGVYSSHYIVYCIFTLFICDSRTGANSGRSSGYIYYYYNNSRSYIVVILVVVVVFFTFSVLL